MPGNPGSQLRWNHKSQIVWGLKKKRPRNGSISKTRPERVVACRESVQNGPKMTHLTDNYVPSNSGPCCTRQAHHYYRNPQHYVGPRGRHAWDPKLGSGSIFLKLTILILGLAGETKSAVYPLRPEPGLGSSRRGAVLYVCSLYIKIKYEINAARMPVSPRLDNRGLGPS